MMNRRFFIAAGCCALHATFSPRSLAQNSEYICGSVDRGADIDTKMQLDRYSADAGFDRQLLETVVKEFKLTPFGTASLGHRWRLSDGMTPNSGMITLGVHFLNGTDTQKEAVRQAAVSWLSGQLGTKLKFEFDVPRDRAQIAINFNTNRNNSIVGRASEDYVQSQPTMNLFDIVPHVIMHEFGHAIGLQHEHQNPSTSIQWNKPVVIVDMAQQGWSPEMCEGNIFSRFNQNYACVGDPEFNKTSVMLYPVPSRWTLDGFSSGTNASISSGDRKCVEGIYRA